MNKKILIVEDEVEIARLLQVNLRVDGYDTVIANSGEDGLRETDGNRPDLIMLDLKLPGISGWDVLTRLKDDTDNKNIPVIVMTAAVGNGQTEKLYNMGASLVVAKPFQYDEVLNQLNNILNGAG